MEAAPGRTERLLAPAPPVQATPAGLAVRAGVAALLGLAVFLVPVFTNTTWDDRISLAAIFAVIGLSMNVLTGYAGQVSLGHQGLVGIGAFTSAVMVRPSLHASFFVALPIAGLAGAAVALALGLVALRIRGLYLALVTLAFGLVAQGTIFNIREFSGAGAGVPAPRPAGFHSNQAYAYLCLLFLGLFLLVDWRMAKTKAGRAFVALRASEQTAAAFGINVVSYKVLAFTVSGFIAGVAGSLFAHQAQFVFAGNFDFSTSLVWVLMAVVGGLGSRSGIVISSALFALFPFLLLLVTEAVGYHFDPANLAGYTPLLAAVLALAVLTRFPGGLARPLTPVRRWLAGGPIREAPRRDEAVLFEPSPETEPATQTFPPPPSLPVLKPPGPAGDGTAPEGATRVPVPPIPKPPQRRGLRAFRRRSPR